MTAPTRALWCCAIVALFAAAQTEATRAESVPIHLTRAMAPGSALELRHWPSNGWVVQQDDQSASIRFPDLQRRIEPAKDLLQALPAGITGLSTETRDGDAILVLTLGCACPLSVRAAGSDKVVIDVIRTAAGSAAPPGGTPAPVTSPLPVRKGSAAASVASGEVGVEQARAHLLEQLRRAADAGIVDLHAGGETPDAPEAPVAVAETGPAAEGTPGPEQTKASSVTAKGARPALASQQDDPEEMLPPIAQAPQDGAHGTAEPACYSREDLKLPDPLGSGGLARQIGKFRRGLIGEFDTADPEAALALAKLYLGSGLGVEASYLIDEFAANHRLGAIHRAMAQLVEGDTLPPGSPVHKADCVGDQALWRALAHALEGADNEAVQAESAAGRALERLPISLRHRVAAPIGLSAARSGAWTAARRIEALSNRSAPAPGGHPGSILLLSAALADWHGDENEAETLRQEARHSPSPGGWWALLDIAETALGDDGLPAAEATALSSDLAALARNQKGSQLGAEAFALEVQLLKRTDSLDAAVALLSHGVSARLFPAERYPELLSQLAGEAPSGSPGRDLALSYLEDPEKFAPALQHGSFRRALVASMIEVGLAALTPPILRDSDRMDDPLMLELAEAFLRASAPREALEIAAALPASASRAHVMGAALLGSGQPDKAVPYLTSAADDETIDADLRATRLEAQIRAAMRGGHRDAAMRLAAKALELRPDPENAERLALMALRGDAEEMPDPAATVLRQQAPDRLARLQLLFTRGTLSEAASDAPSVADYLGELDAEISLLEGLLGDG